MKLPIFITFFAAKSDAAGKWTTERPELSKKDANSFLKRNSKSRTKSTVNLKTFSSNELGRGSVRRFVA
jgi:hypothetical protein